ncbi:MAG: hypothetical protein JWP75_2458 [Frondihabitans sp.]|nr:hypothetical protein [Frondihabitans sp.]
MDHETRKFIRQAKYETRLLMEQCSRGEDETFDNEVEVLMRSGMGGSANLAFFIPYLWRHRR